MPWRQPLPGLRCKAYPLDGHQLRLAVYTREMPPHWCERGHVGLILEGRFEIRFDREIVVYESGDGLWIPAGPAHRHMAVSLTDSVTAILWEDV